MKTKFQKPRTGCARWVEAPARYSITRLSDRWERFTDRKPRIEVLADFRFMVWDHENKEQLKP